MMNKLKLRMLTLAAVSVAVAAPGCRFISESSRGRKEAAEWKQSYEDQKMRAEVADLTAANHQIALQKALSRINKAEEHIARLRKENAALREQVTDLQRKLAKKQGSADAATTQ